MLMKAQIIKVKVDTEQQHENSNDPLLIRAVGGDAVRFDAESAGAGRSEHVQQAVKKGHPSRQFENDHDHAHARVDQV